MRTVVAQWWGWGVGLVIEEVGLLGAPTSAAETCLALEFAAHATQEAPTPPADRTPDAFLERAIAQAEVPVAIATRRERVPQTKKLRMPRGQLVILP